MKLIISEKWVRGSFFFTFILILLSGVSIHCATAAVNLPRTGQAISLGSSGYSCFPTDAGCQQLQDANVRAGLYWSTAQYENPRFVDNNNGTVTDNLTGLMWLKDADCFGSKKWNEAIWAIVSFNGNVNPYVCDDYSATYTDWRVPNIIELESLLGTVIADYFSLYGFKNISSNNYYWSSTSHSLSSGYKWAMHVNGQMDEKIGGGAIPDSGNPKFPLWPVRNVSNGKAKVWRTGQTTCYDMSGNAIGCSTTFGKETDGGTRAGESWPATRFNNHGNGTVTDNLTGLMWTAHMNCLAALYPSFDNDDTATDGRVTWPHALDFVDGVNKGTYPGCRVGHTDWRLPNRKELLSLIDYQNTNPALQSSHPFAAFPNPFGSPYWSSSVESHFSSSNRYAWRVDLYDGHLESVDDGQTGYVWMVRTAEGVNVTTRYVSPSGADKKGCENSYDPCRSINYAVAKARESRRSCTIKVAQGSYNERIFFDTPVPNLVIQGGWSTNFATRSTNPDLTVVDIGAIGLKGNVINILGGSYLSLDKKITVEGLTIKKGEAGISVNVQRGKLDVTLKNNKVIENQTPSSGGGLQYSNYASDESAKLTIEKNFFVSNSSKSDGGGLYVHSTAALDLNIMENQIWFNHSDREGGGLYLSVNNPLSIGGNTSTALIQKNFISLNSAGGNGGGGLYVETTGKDSKLNLTMANNVTVANLAPKGAGLYLYGASIGETGALNNVKILNDTIASNWASGPVGGIWVESDWNGKTNLQLVNTILWGNIADNPANGVDMTIALHSGGTVSASYSDIASRKTVSGTYSDNGGNINKDPQFINPFASDYHLKKSSPLKDAGICGANQWDPINFVFNYVRIAPYDDIEGDKRPVLNKLWGCDIGADEYVQKFFWPMFMPAIIGSTKK